MLFDISKYISKPISGIIQVGAHHGNEYEFLKKLCSKIIMFEPQKNVFDVLSKNVSYDTEVILENFALGSSKGKMKMYTETANSGQSSSLLVPGIHTVQYPGIQFNGEEEVDVITLNEYFKDKVFDFNLITLDVQGYELEVLKGASDILNSVDYILCEVNRAELYVGCPMVDDIDAYLKEYKFTREFTSWDGYTWGDAFYVKKNS